MSALSLDAELPLTCTRSGSCCHGHRIGVTAWEIAILARDLGISPAECRDRHTEEGATRLRFNGLPDHLGRSACTFFSAGRGCSVHQSRPLACRVYPLARRRDREHSTFTFAGGTNPCLTRCPEVQQLPTLRLGDWLASQHLAPGLAAHDAYGDLVWGLLVTAATIAASSDMKIGSIVSEAERRILLSGDERIPFLPPPWFDLLTVPELPIDPSDPVAFVGAHARRLQQAIANDFALPRIRQPGHGAPQRFAFVDQSFVNSEQRAEHVLGGFFFCDFKDKAGAFGHINSAFGRQIRFAS
jgi:Fe-S-cluster containining protein